GQTADWATAPREELRARLRKAKARLFASKPLRARTHAIANKAKQCAERLEKVEGNKRKAQEALRRAVEVVERAEKVHADLLEQRVALQAELVQLQQQAPQAPQPRPAGQAMAQDAIGGLGITVGELEAVVLQQLSAHPNEEQPVPAEAPAEEQAIASQDLASTAEEVRDGAERDGQSQPAPEAAAPGSGSGAAVVPRWQPEEESVEQLQQRLRKHGLELEGCEESDARARCVAVASGGFQPVLLVQEHRARDHDGLAALQQAMMDHGYAGLWAPAVQGPRDEAGASGGVAVLARSHIIVTSLPFLERPLAARPVVAHVRWGVAGGFVAISAYFHDSAGWNGDYQHVAAVLVKYLAKLSAAGIDWVAGGGFDIEPGKFPVQQLHGVRGLWAAAEDATCRPRAGAWSTLDYFLFSASLAPRLGRPRFDEYGTTKPHLPVAMEMHAQDLPMQERVARGPRPIGPVPPVGCSRGVQDWRMPRGKVRAAVCREHFAEAWGAVVATVEQELLGRYDVVGHDSAKYVGRSGALDTTLVAVKWRPPRRRAALGRQAAACRAPSRSARHLMGVGTYVAKAVRQLHGASLLCPLFEAQFDKLAGSLLEAAAYRDKIIASRGTLAFLPRWVQDFFGQRMQTFAQADFAGQASRVVEYASGQYEAALAAQQKKWVKWANESLSHGAGRAHRCSKVRPGGIEEWDVLPELTVEKVKRAALSFPTGMAMGPAKLGMRALSFLSEDSVHLCAQPSMRMEKMGAWPEGRLWRAMSRLPKPSGGCRPIALMHDVVRWWSRAWADISKGWLMQHPSVDIWGLGAGRSSSNAAFDLGLATEVAVALEEQVVAVLQDAWKFFETVTPEALIQEARLLKMPLPLVWLLVELYRQLRRLQAFGSVSYEVVSYQVALAGCTHACALVSVLMHRVLGRARCMGVTPRALVDDVALQWVRTAGSNVGVLWAAVTRFRVEAKQLGIIVQPAKSGYVTSSKGLAAECRKHAGSRGLQLLHWVTVLWRTGLPTSAGHGAGVVGISDDELQRLRAEASRLAGARPGPSGAAISLASQRSARFDPVYEATVALVVRYSSWVWEQRTSLGRLQRAWASITQRLVEKPTWGLARGPSASTTLALWRVGWHMRSSLVLVTDEEQHVNLIATSPSDLKAYLVEGVSRWQGRQILSHFGGAQPTGPIWMRVLRLCVGGKGAAVAEVPAAVSLRIHWADAPGHRLRGCEASPPGGSELGTACVVANRPSVEQDVLPDRLQQILIIMRDKGLQAGGVGVADFSGFEHEVGLPVPPPRVPPAADEAEVRLWGD
ncbi:unnamed protein product, partial [Prorocentrum cordatum]